ncbi:hypothetical protein EZ428_15165 [Pedobacter frigiditerrae]|uniref:GtrA/DPMS transmembrane domain-containing protein n=1 Tax=Pedobacter frigiditerrae TaxID=2530452 RepID=A0A4R0MXB6_9SPHI|nr:hypothetical protein EZ428_15165 [Pedobacter frigiditerrae]
MIKKGKKINNAIIIALDVFYPIFKNVLTFEVYRYLAVGGICFFLNFSIFHLSYYFIYSKYLYQTPLFEPYFLALLTSLSFTLPAGFYLNKNFVFKGSHLKLRTQLLRYSFTTIGTVILSKILMDIMVGTLSLNLTASFLLNVFIVQFANFIVQKNLSFYQK